MKNPKIILRDDEDVNLYYIVEAAVSRVSELMRFLRRKVKTEDLIDLPSAEEWMNRLYDEWPIHGRTLSTGRTLKKNAGEISLTILAEIFAWYHDEVGSLTIYTQDTDAHEFQTNAERILTGKTEFTPALDDFCSADKTAEEVAEYFNGKTIDKIRSEFITNRQNNFEEGTLTHRQAKYGYALSEDRRNLVLNPESAQVVKLIFQMYLEDMKIPEIARALDVQGVQTPQVQMAKKKRLRTKNKWQDSTIRSILKNPLYIGKCTLTLAKARRELEVPAIVSETEFQKAQKKLESTRLPSRKKARKKPNLLFKKIYDKESGKGLLCRTSEDESQQIYSFDKGYRCFSGKAPFIESEKIFREILSALEKEKMQAAHIDRVLDLNPEKVKQCMDAGLLQYRKRANEIVAHLMAKDDERTAVYRQYEQGSILLEQVEEYEHQYQVAVQKQEAAFKKVMLAVNDMEKAFSHGNPWLMKFRAISIPEKLERTHLKEWLDHVWIVDFEQVEVILQESEWKRFFPEEWLNNGEEDCNGKKE